MGQSIGYVKAVIHNEYGFAVASTTLELNGTVLIDPMSICDYPQINAADGATFTVKVPLMTFPLSPALTRSCGLSNKNPYPLCGWHVVFEFSNLNIPPGIPGLGHIAPKRFMSKSYFFRE